MKTYQIEGNGGYEFIFSKELSEYLKSHGLLEEAKEYARVNAVKFGNNTIASKLAATSLFSAFSWSDTAQGYGFWSNHHNRYLTLQRLEK